MFIIGGGGAGARGEPRGGAAGLQMSAFLNRGRQEGGLQAGSQRPRQDRSSSAGKRQRTDEAGGFQEQRPYRSSGRQQRAARQKAEVLKGSSTEFAELAGPVTWWVGKCRPDTTEDKVKEVLEQLAATKCAQPHQGS